MSLAILSKKTNVLRTSNSINIVNTNKVNRGMMFGTFAKRHYHCCDKKTVSSSSIIPEVPLYVTITTHDIHGNVFLSEMQNYMVLVIPSDNSGDVFPPSRLTPPQLTDRPSDDGDGVFVTFQESDASDISEYWILAHNSLCIFWLFFIIAGIYPKNKNNK